MKKTLLVCAMCLVGFVNSVVARESVIPAVFAYLCDDNPSTEIGQCGAPPHPVYGTAYQLHFVHTWFQLVNTSNHTFTSDDEIKLYVYGKNGQKANIDLACANQISYSNDDGSFDLTELSGDGTTVQPGEAVFLYIQACMNDGNDDNAPFYAKLVIHTATHQRGKVVYNVGSESNTIDGQGRDRSNASTMVDKETVRIR